MPYKDKKTLKLGLGMLAAGIIIGNIIFATTGGYPGALIVQGTIFATALVVFGGFKIIEYNERYF